ncbi:MAG: hypothetical protein ABH852_01065 [Methanobacteriota archaeon]
MTDMKKNSRWKTLVGMVASVVVLALALSAFSSALGWPTSLLTFGIMVVVAWFLAAGVGGKIEGGRWSVAVATLLAVGLVVSTLAVSVPWNLKLTDEQAVGENVEFKMEASFTYLGSENNIPIENIALRFPCPNLDNKTEQLLFSFSWILYWQDDDGTLHLQATDEKLYEFKGERTATLGIVLSGIEPTIHGPKLYYNLDMLYPREVFWIEVFVLTSGKDSKRVSILEFGENQRTDAYYAHWPLKSEFIDVSFWAQLSKKIDEVYEPIETFSRGFDNGYPGWYWLYF